MPIIRKELVPDDFFPLSIRLNDGVIERSADGGTTWEPSPIDDPRINDQYLFPPLGAGSDCDAAISMVQWIHDRTDAIVAGLYAAATFGDIALALLSTLVELVPAEILLILLIELVTDAATVTAVVLDTAMTDTVYSDLVCILRCLLDDNGQIDATRLDTARQQVNDHYATTPEWILNAWFDILGYVGLSNAGTLGLGSGDCDDCASCEWIVEFDMSHADNDGWVQTSFPYRGNKAGTYILGTRDAGDTGAPCVYVGYPHLNVQIRQVDFLLDYDHGSNFSGSFLWYDETSWGVSAVLKDSVSWPTSHENYWYSLAADFTSTDGVLLGLNAATNNTGHVRLYKIRLTGVGDLPPTGLRIQ